MSNNVQTISWNKTWEQAETWERIKATMSNEHSAYRRYHAALMRQQATCNHPFFYLSSNVRSHCEQATIEAIMARVDASKETDGFSEYVLQMTNNCRR